MTFKVCPTKGVHEHGSMLEDKEKGLNDIVKIRFYVHVMDMIMVY